MAASRLAGLVFLGAMATGCTNVLPVPDYVVGAPPPYRVSGDGARVDNENIRLDAEGYRVDDRGERYGIVDVPAKTGNESANSMGGYYDSSIGADLPVRVDTTMERAGVEPGVMIPGTGPMPGGASMPSPR